MSLAGGLYEAPDLGLDGPMPAAGPMTAMLAASRESPQMMSYSTRGCLL